MREIRIKISDTEVIQRAVNTLGALLKDLGIDHRRGQALVSEKLLDSADVGAALKEISGERMSEGIGANVLGQARPAHGDLNRLVDDAGVNVMAARLAGARVHRQIAGRKHMMS